MSSLPRTGIRFLNTGGSAPVSGRCSPLGDVPAILVGYRNDVLARNPGHALFFRHLSFDASADRRLTALIGELSVNRQEFARLWAVHRVRQCRATTSSRRHPHVGALTLNHEVMELAQDTGQRLFIYTAEPSSPSEAGLRLLAGLTAENAAKAESGRRRRAPAVRPAQRPRAPGAPSH